MKKPVFLLYTSTFRTFIYALLRRMICPFHTMEKHLKNQSKIADIGCGQGLFSLYVALKNRSAKVYGFEPDFQRLRKGKLAARNCANVRFICGYYDPRGIFDAVCLSDVLHHLGSDAQVDLLKRIYQTLSETGVLLIKEVCTNDGPRYFLSSISDRLLYPADKICFRSKIDWIHLLETHGYSVTHKRIWYLLFSTNLFIARKSAAGQ